MTDNKPSAETPISKYLANLERRKSFYPPPSSPPHPHPPPSSFYSHTNTLRRGGGGGGGIQMKINFDDTFFSADESVLVVSPNMNKKRRLSTVFTMDESGGEGNEVELERKINDLERLLRQTQAELIDGRTAYSKLDQANSDMRTAHAQKINALEKSHDEMKIAAKNASERADLLEKKLLSYQKRDSENVREHSSTLQSQMSKISSLEEKLSALQIENAHLATELSQTKIQKDEEIRHLLSSADKYSLESQKCSLELSALREKISSLSSKLAKVEEELLVSNEENKKLKEKEVELEKLKEDAEKIGKLEEKLRGVENSYIKELSAKAEFQATLKKIEDENSLMRGIARREHLLEEQILSLESEVKVLKGQLVEKGQVEGEICHLKEVLKAWVNVGVRVDPGGGTPSGFEKVWREMQEKVFELKLNNTEMSENYESTKRFLKNAQNEITVLKGELKRISDEKEKFSTEAFKLSRRMSLIVKDRDGLRELKESYEKEFESTELSAPLKLRISQLELIVQDYEAIFQKEKKECENCAQLKKSNSDLQSRISAVESEREELSKTLSETRELTLNNTTGLKVVSFGLNPSLLSIESRLKEALAENEELRARIKGYEEDTIMAGRDPNLEREKRELEENHRVLERKYELLRDSYDFESVQLSIACSKLFGFSVVLQRGEGENPNSFRLQSIYTTAADEYFIIQEGSEGEMLLLDTPILALFRSEIQKYLHQESSIPSFFSSVTLSYISSNNSQSLSQPEIEQNSSDNSHHSINENSENNESGDEEQETIQIESYGTLQPQQVEIEAYNENEDVESVGGSENYDEVDDDEGEVVEEEDEDEGDIYGNMISINNNNSGEEDDDEEMGEEEEEEEEEESDDDIVVLD